MDFAAVESLVRAITPDVRDVAIYILDAQGWAAPLDLGLAVSAFTSGMIDLAMASQLSRRGQWHGRGFCTILYPSNMPASPRCITGVTLHELAHWCTFSHEVRTCEIATDLETASAVATALFVDAENAATVSEQRRPPWHHHEVDFLRAATHIGHRYCKLVDTARPWDLQFSQRYYGTCEMNFMRVLDSELHRMADEPIASILHEPPPADFNDLIRCLTSWWNAEETG